MLMFLFQVVFLVVCFVSVHFSSAEEDYIKSEFNKVQDRTSGSPGLKHFF